MCGIRNKLSKPKTQKQSEENIIKGIRKKKKKINNIIIKCRKITDIRTLFEQEHDYYKPIRVGNF